MKGFKYIMVGIIGIAAIVLVGYIGMKGLL